MAGCSTFCLDAFQSLGMPIQSAIMIRAGLLWYNGCHSMTLISMFQLSMLRWRQQSTALLGATARSLCRYVFSATTPITTKVLARNMGSPAHAFMSPKDLQTQTHAQKQKNDKAVSEKRLDLLICVNAVQALLFTAAGTDLTKGCLSQRNVQEQQALDLAFHGRQWYAVQLLVTAGKTSF